MPRPSPTPKRQPGARPVAEGRGPRAMAGMLDPIITMNAQGFIQSASDSTQDVFGWAPSELMGRNIRVLIPEPKRSDLDRYLDRYRNGDQAEALKRIRSFAAVRKDGSPLEIELSMSRAKIPGNDSPFFVGIVRDVGQTIHAGANSADEHTRLQQLITEQTRALASANLRLHLSDRLASIGTLAAGLGHDMSNVLLPVRARLNALEHSGLSNTALEHVEAMRRSIGYLQHLSDGLHFLSLDPDSAGMDKHGATSTDIAKWWEQVGTLLRNVVPKHVTLKANMQPGLPPVKIAPHWLTQAVLNLIVNAGEAIPKSQRPARVVVRAARSDDGHSVVLTVTDNGRGMAPGIQRRAFDMFFTTKSRAMGTGLGLPLARKLAMRAGGNVELISVAGGGTTARLILAIAPKKRQSTAPAPGGVQLASISVPDHRAAALLAQVLIGSGVKVTAGTSNGPGASDLWVTTPTPAALSKAAAWRKRDQERTVVLVGAPPKHTRLQWAGLGAAIIDPPTDFEMMRHTLHNAVASRGKTRKGRGTS